MKKLLLSAFISTFLFTNNGLFAQTNTKKSSYFPQNMGSNINSEYDEINPVMSPDGKTLYFIRVDHPENHYGKHHSMDVWYSELQPDKKTWGPAKRVEGVVNKGRYNAILGISADGKSYLIAGQFHAHDKWYKSGFSLVGKFGSEWGDPKKVKIPAMKRLNEGYAYNAFLTNDGQYIFFAITRRFNSKRYSLWVSKNDDGKWRKPRLLPKTVNNVKYSEESPYLSGNNEVLYFASNHQSVHSDNYDIYMTRRLGTDWDQWTEPVRFKGDTLNSNEYDAYFKTNRKGSWGYFTSTKNGTNGSADIFQIKIFEENPYVVLSGKIINKLSGKPITDKKDYTLTSPGITFDSLKINFDSATYKLKLPFGKKYFVSCVLKNYLGITDTIRADTINEYTEMTRDLYVEPIPYVLVKGSFIDKANGLIIPGGASPKVILNGVLADSAKINLGTSTYELKVPFGRNHSIGVQAFKYNPVPDTLNLKEVTEYKEIFKNLYGSREVEKIVFATKAIITGKVIDKKTNKPISNTVPFNIQVDKLPDLAANINVATSEYTLEVDLGQLYTINAKAEKYYPVFEQVDLTKEKGAIKVIKDLVLAPIEVGQAIRMNNIFFDPGKAVLKPASFPELDKLAKFLLDNPGMVVEIAGHTDNTGSAQKNTQLSRWRARACELYVESKGVTKDQVTFNGYGPSKPVASNATKQGKALNRRVEFVIKEFKK
ncbi:MAG: OmpA family protein [Cytophagales bacterium]|nr:OmpA family protein [Cytophagales bacterium]